jgi:ATP-dependent DNA ligase
MNSGIPPLTISTADRVMRIIENMEATSGRVEKQELLEELAGLDIGRWALKQAYDPFITYGLTPGRTEGQGRLTLKPATVSKLLEDLATRKLTGNAAQREVAEVMMALDRTGAELLWRILSKDLKCGIAASTINTVVPGLIPVFSVMRAHKFEEKRMKSWPQIVEPKLDGYRFTFLCRDGQGGFFSRTGIRQAAADHLVEPMIETAIAAYQKSVAHGTELHKLLSKANDNRGSMNFMADGEMIVDGSFAETGALRRKEETAAGAMFHIFDMMSLDDFNAVGSVGLAYLQRRKMVEEFVSASSYVTITKTPRYFANSIEEIHKLYEGFRNRGLEGAMVKNPAGLYDKKKSYGWLKIKAEESEDLPIVGAYPGEPNTKYADCLGGLVVKRANGVNVRVGGGISDDQRIELWALFQKELARTDKGLVKYHKDEILLDAAHFADKILIHRLIEVLFHEETPDGSLRHPRLKCFRDDKVGEVESREAA